MTVTARRPRSRNGHRAGTQGGRPASGPGGDAASLRSLPRAALASRLGPDALRLAALARGEGSPLALPEPVP